ncbi:MAG: hypothetical protein QXM27_02800 [Candidatus Pacearchaeota archaeon]
MKYIVRIEIENTKRSLYAIFSTVIMSFISPFYKTLKDLYKENPEFLNQKPQDTFKAIYKLDENKIPYLEIKYKVIKLQPK